MYWQDYQIVTFSASDGTSIDPRSFQQVVLPQSESRCCIAKFLQLLSTFQHNFDTDLSDIASSSNVITRPILCHYAPLTHSWHMTVINVFRLTNRLIGWSILPVEVHRAKLSNWVHTLAIIKLQYSCSSVRSANVYTFTVALYRFVALLHMCQPLKHQTANQQSYLCVCV